MEHRACTMGPLSVIPTNSDTPPTPPRGNPASHALIRAGAATSPRPERAREHEGPLRLLWRNLAYVRQPAVCNSCCHDGRRGVGPGSCSVQVKIAFNLCLAYALVAAALGVAGRSTKLRVLQCVDQKQSS
eukprot:scaffold9949_cov19-Tisochrysis_lutea.AAC.3